MEFPHGSPFDLADWHVTDHQGRRLPWYPAVSRTLPLITELDRRARALAMSRSDLARQIGLDRSQLSHIRSGRDRVSLGTLHLIGRWFPNDAAIQRLVWEYIVHDVETPGERRLREEVRSSEGAAHALRLTEESLISLRAFVADLPSHAVEGSGLLIVSTATSALSAAAGFLEAELHARRVQVMRKVASAPAPASAVSALVAVQVLIVERLDHASASMAAVLRSRAIYGKVTVATSVEGVGTALQIGTEVVSLRLAKTRVTSPRS